MPDTTLDIQLLVAEAFERAHKETTGKLFDASTYTRIPFKLSQGIWGRMTDTYYGSVQCCSKELWDKFHWAILSDNKVIFSWEIGIKYLIDKHVRRYESPGENFDYGSGTATKTPAVHRLFPARFFIGQRLFFGRSSHGPISVGTIRSTRSYSEYQHVPSGPDWATTSTNQHYTSLELADGRVRIGARPHV